MGDYCRCLGRQFEDLGHTVQLVALNDHWISDAVSGSQGSLPTLRLSSASTLEERFVMVNERLRDFQPDLVSLHYVCYGFHHRGLPWRWNRVLEQIGAEVPGRHLMFHELWIGEGSHPSIKQRLFGMGQRWLIRDLVRRFRPHLVTTSMALYQRRLSRLGVASKVLPLFGQIPIVPRDDTGVVNLLMSAGCGIDKKPREAFLNGVFFGLAHPTFDVMPLIKWLAELRREADKPILLSMVGRAGSGEEGFARRLTDSLPDNIELVLLGEQPEDMISQVLQFADFGVSTSSSEYVGKSSTFATMRAHGLPMVLADGEVDPIFRDAVPPVVQFSASGSATAIMNCTHSIKLEAVAAHAAHDLLQLLRNTPVANHDSAFTG